MLLVTGNAATFFHFLFSFLGNKVEKLENRPVVSLATYPSLNSLPLRYWFQEILSFAKELNTEQGQQNLFTKQPWATRLVKMSGKPKKKKRISAFQGVKNEDFHRHKNLLHIVQVIDPRR